MDSSLINLGSLTDEELKDLIRGELVISGADGQQLTDILAGRVPVNARE